MKALVFVTMFLSWGVFASCTPTLSNYSVDNIYTGEVHSLQLSSEQKNYVYGEYLTAAQSANKVNFAGHYILFVYGCGGGALCAGVKDALNGHLLDTGTDAYDSDSWEGATFKTNSSLLIMAGRSFDSKKSRDDYYKLERDNLIKIKECY